MMSVREVTLEETISLSRQLPPAERLRLISILSDELSREATAEAPPELAGEDEEAQMLAKLRAAGLLMDPTPEMLAWAEEYDAKYSPEEQAAILEELRSLHLDPPLSEIVIRAREFRPGWEWIVEKGE
jgi:hypothetical protein